MFTQAIHTFIKDQRSIPVGIKLIVLVTMLRAVGWGFVDPYFPLYLSDFRENYAMIGLLFAMLPLGSILAAIPLMRLADRVRDTSITRDGELLYFLVVVSYLLAGLLHRVELLMLTLFLNGVAHSLVMVGAETYIRKHDRLGRSTPFGMLVALDYFGWIVGMLIGSQMIQFTGFNWMFLWVLPSTLAGIIILPFIREKGLRSILVGFRKYFHSRKDFSDIFTDIRTFQPKMFFFFLLAFFDGVIRMFSYVFIPLLGLAIHLPLPSIALLMAAMYIPFIFSFFFSEAADQFKRMNVIATGLFIGAGSYLLLHYVVDQSWIILLAIMTSFSLAIIRPAYNGAISRLTPRHMMGEVTSLNNFFERLGRIIGPVVTGIIADIYGISVAFLVVAILATGLGVISLILSDYNHLAEVAD